MAGNLNIPVREGTPWHALPVAGIFVRLDSSKTGLTSQDAGRRLARDGPNLLQETERANPLAMFGSQFKSVVVVLLVAAGIVAGLVGESLDCTAILAIVILNAVIGFYQEWTAEKAISALKKMTAPLAKVSRDGQTKTIPASDVVCGDVIEFEAGDLIAADARLLNAASLRCGEAILTGESQVATKRVCELPAVGGGLGDRQNMVFAGTSVVAGAGRAIVIATAMKTEMGRIAALIEQAGEDATPLQAKLTSFGRVLVWASLGIVAALFLIGLARNSDTMELFLTSVSLAIAAVPEGLPAIVTIALAMGVMRMSRRHALIRKLPAVETLGSATVICTDKTGTLTVGEMTVSRIFVAGRAYEVSGEGYSPTGDVRRDGDLLRGDFPEPLKAMGAILAGCNNARLQCDDGIWRALGDPTEGALLSAARKLGADQDRIEMEMPREADFPFDSDRKMHSTVRRKREGGFRVLVNGAPEFILAHCDHVLTATGVRLMSQEDRADIARKCTELAAQGLRVLGAACRDFTRPAPDGLVAEAMEDELVFVGLAAMYDPPRPQAKEAIEQCKSAGIRVVMITGDHLSTGSSIARTLGITADTSGTLTGEELDNLADEALRRRVVEISVYARVTAEHKLRIVRAWQANGAVVAMTGDGVNDAPALKGADIGVAMGRTGTDVAKQAADMIISDDRFETIVAAVEVGRGIFENIRKTLSYLLAGNFGELLVMAFCALGGFPIPLLPIHLLWINLVTDGLPALCLAIDPIESDVMRRAPRQPQESLTGRKFYTGMVLTGILTAAVALIVYLDGLQFEPIALARTHAFSVLVFAELFRSFGARSEIKPLWRIPIVTNLKLAWIVGISIALQIFIQHNHWLAGLFKTALLPWSDLWILLPISLLPLFVIEAMKSMSCSVCQRAS